MDPRRLKNIPLFGSLEKKDLEMLARLADEIDLPAGSPLTSEGAFAYEFCVIEEGKAEVVRGGAPVATLGPGDFFGEIGLLETPRRVASVVATTPMRLIVMGGRDFRSMLAGLPAVRDEIARVARERLAEGAAGDAQEDSPGS